MRAIFISYRRSDSEGEAGRLSDLLTSRFSDQSVFMDVDSIKPGRDFRKAIEESVQNCSVLLALIGPSWAEVQDDRGGRRLDAPNDYVRLEIAAALQRDIPVIPVLVRGARMPQAEHLPSEIQDLAYRNSVELTHARWKSDLQVLIDALEPLLHPPVAAPAFRPSASPAAIPVRPRTPAFAPLQSSPGIPVERPHLTPRSSSSLPPRRPGNSPFANPTFVRPVAPGPAVRRDPPPAYLPPVTPASAQSLSLANSVAVPPAPPDAVPAALSADVTEQVAKHLAHFIGPIAEIVVRRAARSVPSLETLCTTVGQEIEAPADRAKFLALCRK